MILFGYEAERSHLCPGLETARREYRRESARCTSDLMDREWAPIKPFMLPPCRIGRPRKTDLREVVNAVLYQASTGCQWRMLPKDFPPVSTVQRYFYQWRDSRLWQTIRFHPAMQARECEGREAQPSAGVIACPREGGGQPALRQAQDEG